MKTYENQQIDAADIEPYSTVSKCIITNTEAIIVADIRFDRCIFEFSTIENSEWIRCEFRYCDLSNKNIYESYLSDVTFDNCKLLATTIAKSSIKGITINGCLCREFSIIETKVDHYRMKSSDWSLGAFRDIKYRHVVLNENKVDGLDFADTVLKDIDLRDCEFDSIVYTPRLIKGLKIRSDQALGFVMQMGIKVDA